MHVKLPNLNEEVCSCYCDIPQAALAIGNRPNHIIWAHVIGYSLTLIILAQPKCYACADLRPVGVQSSACGRLSQLKQSNGHDHDWLFTDVAGRSMSVPLAARKIFFFEYVLLHLFLCMFWRRLSQLKQSNGLQMREAKRF